MKEFFSFMLKYMATCLVMIAVAIYIDRLLFSVKEFPYLSAIQLFSIIPALIILVFSLLRLFLPQFFYLRHAVIILAICFYSGMSIYAHGSEGQDLVNLIASISIVQIFIGYFIFSLLSKSP